MIEIISVKHKDEFEGLVELFSLIFGKSGGADYWRWQYIQNPLSGNMPEVTVAVDGAKIVGIRPFMLHELWMGDKKIMAAQHCDTLVHPDYRRQGIFNRMGKFSLQYLAQHNCALSFGFPGPMSRQGFQSQGYQRLMDIEILFKFVNPVNKILSRIKDNKSRDIKGSGFLAYEKMMSFSGNDTYRIEIHDGFYEDLNNLNTLRKDNIIDIVRSEEYLNWRFDDHFRNKYRYVLLKKGKNLQGYAVISVQKQYKGLIAGIIIDYVVKDDDAECFQLLISTILDLFNNSSCQVVATWAMSSTILSNILIKSYGFKSSTKFPYRNFIGSAYMDLIVIDSSMSEVLDIYDKNNWKVTYAYPNFT